MEINYSELQIVGYANVLRDDMLPSIVAPIFKTKDGPLLFILPPLTTYGGVVVGIETRDQKMVWNDQNTRIEEIEPLIDHELWIDTDRKVHYEPIPVARLNLDKIGDEALEKAKHWLNIGNFIVSLHNTNAANVAYSGLKMEPFAITVVIARIMKDIKQEKLSTKLAEGLGTSQEFFELVASYSKTG